MINNIKAVIFDLDGTLVDSMWLWKAIDIDYLGRFGLILPDDLKDDIEGYSFTETAFYFKKRFKLEDTIEKIKQDWNLMAYDYYAHKVPLKKGVIKLLEYLKNKNIPIGIGTSNSIELVELVLKTHGITDYFQTISTSCKVKKGKPAPDVFLKAAENLGVKPDKCIVFEDIPNGIIAAKRAGMKVCAIYDDFSKDITDVKKKLADYYILDYDQLLTEYEVD